MAIGGGGFVSSVVPSKAEQGLIYARTDVGGAYRYDKAAGRWQALTDWVSVSGDFLNCTLGWPLSDADRRVVPATNIGEPRSRTRSPGDDALETVQAMAVQPSYQVEG